MLTHKKRAEIVEKRKMRHQFVFKNEAHKKRADKIALMFFNGNYREKPSNQSIYAFAMKPRREKDIRHFLSSKAEQNLYTSPTK